MLQVDTFHRTNYYNSQQAHNLLGRKVIDLLEGFLDCKTDIRVNINSEAWCYIKDEYKLRRSFFLGYSRRKSSLERLTIDAQAYLHAALNDLAQTSNQYYLTETRGWRRKGPMYY
jgi:hypothetical protein